MKRIILLLFIAALLVNGCGTKSSYDADVEGVSCFIQFSEGASIVERSIPVPPVGNSLQTNFGGVHTVNPILEYYRVIYTNNPTTAQTSFTVSSILAGRSGIGLVSRSTQVLNKHNDVALRRIVSEPDTDRNLGYLGYQVAKRKFGKHLSVPGTATTIWTAPSNWVPNQNLETIEAVSSLAADGVAGAGARTIEVTFLDANWEEVTETLTMNGTTPTTPTTVTGYRVLSAKVKDVGTYHGSNLGNITLQTSTSGDVLGYMSIGSGGTEQTIYTVPAGKTMYITDILVSVGQANSADVGLYNVPSVDDMIAPTQGKIEEWGLEDFSGAKNFPQHTWLKFTEKSDVWVEATKITGGGNARVSVDFNYILQDNN